MAVEPQFDATQDRSDARTLAAWCAKSGALYNCGAWQAALLLKPKAFREVVAHEIAAMGLPDDHPAVAQWGVGL